MGRPGDKTAPAVSLGWRVFGLGVIALAAVSLALGDFLPGQTVPKGFPDRTALAYAAGTYMLISGAGIEWRRSAAWAAAGLTAYYTFVVVILMGGPTIIRHPAEFGAYSGDAEQLAIAAGALIIYAAKARIGGPLRARLTRVGQITFGVCALLFGGAHFAYMNLTAPLVPKWLPPGQVFWGYATGLAHIAAGLAILTGWKARTAAVLLTIMYAAFTPLVHLPLAFAHPSDTYEWTENALNIALVGVAWVVADSFSRAKDDASP